MKRLFKVENALKQSPGIYMIKCTKSDKVYIGETVNLSRRISKHFSTLRSNRHSNPILQNLFNKYKEDSFVVSVLEYVEIADELQLKILEQQWQKQYPTCIAFDSNEIYQIERSEEWKAKQREYLDDARIMSIQICSIPCIVYDIVDKTIYEFKSLEEATSLIERKHIDQNLKGILIPYKNRYVAFKKEEFSNDKIKEIISINSQVLYTTNRNLCKLYNLITNEVKVFASKTQFSLEFGKRNTTLYDKLVDGNLLDFEFRGTKMPKTKSEFLSMNVNLKPKFTKSVVNLQLFYENLLANTSIRSMAENIKINRATLGEAFKIRSEIEWVRLIEQILSRLPE